MYSLQVFANCHVQSNVEVTVKKNCKPALHLFHCTVLGAAIKCNQYNDIAVESGTHAKSVKITSNMFAVHTILHVM